MSEKKENKKKRQTIVKKVTKNKKLVKRGQKE